MLAFESGEDETIDLVARPTFVDDSRNRWTLERLERPMGRRLLAASCGAGAGSAPAPIAVTFHAPSTVRRKPPASSSRGLVRGRFMKSRLEKAAAQERERDPSRICRRSQSMNR